MNGEITRRAFTKASAATTLGLAAARANRVLGANDRIRLGFIGVANRGGQLMSGFLNHADAEIVASATFIGVRWRRPARVWTQRRPPIATSAS